MGVFAYMYSTTYYTHVFEHNRVLSLAISSVIVFGVDVSTRDLFGFIGCDLLVRYPAVSCFYECIGIGTLACDLSCDDIAIGGNDTLQNSPASPGMITSDVCGADLDDGIDCGEEDANCDEDDDNGDDDEDEDAHVCVLHCCW